MKKTLKIVAVALLAVANVCPVMAGGLNTNTNQNVAFLRNPARDAVIGIDGVYSNPAGVAFMPEGWHVSVNLQFANQTRTSTSTFPGLAANIGNLGNPTKEYKGTASAVIPSVQVALNRGKWAFQFNFAIMGGGGKCEYDDGLGSIESLVSIVPQAFNAFGKTLNGMAAQAGLNPNFPTNCLYTANSKMSGQSYYYGYTLGAAYRINDHWSVYGGARLLYGTTKYYGYVNNIKLLTQEGQNLGDWVRSNTSNPDVQRTIAGLFNDPVEAIQDQKTTALLNTSTALVDGMLKEGISLNCNQDGYGLAPIIGVDYKTGNFNFAAKFEFKTRMRLENKSNNSSLVKYVPSLERFADGTKEAEDVPSLLTVGAQWSVIPQVRVSAGWHHYFDKDARMHQNVNRKLSGDTNEYLLGAEWDPLKVVTVSAGGQRTVYGLSDEFMDDISFSVNSTSIGFGCSVKLSDVVKLNVAYFWTDYQTYNRSQADYNNVKGQLSSILGNVNGLMNSDVTKGLVSLAEIDGSKIGQAVGSLSQQLGQANTAGADKFTRTNHVIGIGADFTF